MQPVLPGNPGPDRTVPGAQSALILLLAINLFNYIDRQVLSAVLPKLELDAEMFSPSDPWLKTKLGALTTAFMLSYMFLSPVFGRIGDRRSRWMIVGIGVILWSLASGGSGLAIGFWMLLATRCLVGVGEAAYGPVAPSMISDMYPEKRRASILSWFYMAIPVGSALGFVLGGQVAETSWGWRGSFLVVVIPGIVLGLICFAMREPPREKPSVEKQTWGDYFRLIRGLLRVRSYRYCTLGLTCITFIQGGIAAWAPYYIFEREARFQATTDNLTKLSDLRSSDGTPVVPAEIITKLRALPTDVVYSSPDFRVELRKHLTEPEYQQYSARIFDTLVAPESITLGTITFRVGAIVVVAGLFATLFGGWLADKLRDKYRGAYFLVCGYSALLAFPLFLGLVFAPFPYAWGFIFLAVFGMFVNTGPANAILANVTPSRVRATGFAFNILIIHLLGDAISPPLIGMIADQSNLSNAFMVVSVFLLGGGILWLWGAKYLDWDTHRVAMGDDVTKG